MISNIMWVPLEFPYKDPDNYLENDDIEIKGMYNKFMEAADEMEEELIKGAKERGMASEFFLRGQESRCEDIYQHLEKFASKVVFECDNCKEFIFDKKYFKGTYIKKYKQ